MKVLKLTSVKYENNYCYYYEDFRKILSFVIDDSDHF